MHGELTERILGSAIQIHESVGPGLAESVYETCLADELRLARLEVHTQVVLPLRCKELHFPQAARMDMVVDGRVIVEIKAVPRILVVHQAQLITYLRRSGIRVGLLLNFHAPQLREGTFRKVL